MIRTQNIAKQLLKRSSKNACGGMANQPHLLNNTEQIMKITNIMKNSNITREYNTKLITKSLGQQIKSNKAHQSVMKELQEANNAQMDKNTTLNAQQRRILGIVDTILRAYTTQAKEKLGEDFKEETKEEQESSNNNNEQKEQTATGSFFATIKKVLKFLGKVSLYLEFFYVGVFLLAYLLSKVLSFTKDKDTLDSAFEQTLSQIHTLSSNIVRTISSQVICIWIALSFLIPHRYYKEFGTQEDIDALHERTAPKIFKFLVDMGGVYIKFGQELSMMRGMLPDAYVDACKPLQDDVRELDIARIKRVIAHEFPGRSFEELFETFDDKPIAAASLAQVHTATLKDGTKVAVKVQYPEVSSYYVADLFMQTLITNIMDWFNDTNMAETEEKLKEELANELNFAIELKNGSRARDNFGFSGDTQDFYIPQFYEDHTSEKVLTMEYIEGVKINNIEAIEKLGYTTEEVARILFTRTSEMAFDHGFVHCDPHPGNVFVRPRPGNPSKPQVVLLDHGLYTELPDSSRIAYRKFWKAIILKDEDAVKDSCRMLGVEDHEMFSTMFLMQSFSEAMDTDETFAKDKQGAEGHAISPDEIDHDRINEMMSDLPPEMLLILRSTFILTAVNMELGAPLSRFSLVSRVAFQKEYEHEAANAKSWGDWFNLAKSYYWFEFELFKMRLMGTLLNIYIRIYSLYGDPNDLFAEMAKEKLQ